VRAAIDGHAPLADLLTRVRASQRRLEVVRPLLPEGLAAALRAGPLDDKAWVLLADHAAAAAKLRQCLPLIEQALAQAGWPAPQVVVRVRPRA
jgi:hypothetical protein